MRLKLGKSGYIHRTSILRLSTDLLILIEVVDTEENIVRLRPKLDEVIKQGLITEEKVKIVFYDSDSNVPKKILIIEWRVL